ncbi:P-loop containing nucleoside triphosphate hydrolase protein [Pyronema omphalodes]|nr:P-loop containing nucleoside triphosphate hydrolase protein [Pyronema omphalodes]
MDIQQRRILGNYLDEYLRSTFAMEKPTTKTDSDHASSPLTPQRSVNLAERSLSEGFSQKSRKTELDRSSSLGFSQMSLDIPKGSDTTSKLTAEQLRVVNTDVSPGDLMKVCAYAGTGKTRCLVEYAKKRPHKKFLYIAYNKSLQLDAQAKFPPNVTCKTIHALALSVLRHTAADAAAAERQMNTLALSWGSKEITKILKFDTTDAAWSAFDKITAERFHHKPQNNSKNSSERTTRGSRRNKDSGSSTQSTGPSRRKKLPLPIHSISTAIKNTLSKFWNSSDEEITDQHLPLSMEVRFGFKKEAILGWAIDIWTDIKAGVHPYLPHDAYLKLLHLNPSADNAAFQNYDIILLDEAQDSNACITEIVLRQQPRMGIIVVGDPYQRIYGFRGARNAPFNNERYPPTVTCRLTWSFRFGDNIARVANILLKAMGEDVPLKGVRKDDAVYDLYAPPTQAQLNNPREAPKEQFVVLFRRNMTLVQYALSFQLLHPHYKMVLKVRNNYKKEILFNNLRDGYRLYLGQPTHSTLLRDFSSWDELADYVHAEDQQGPEKPELELIYGLETLFSSPSFLTDLKNAEKNVIDDEEAADVILTNTHQAKGCEWDNVMLSDDFINFNDRARIITTQYYREEANILYVALTRAKKKLIIGASLGGWLYSQQGGLKYYISYEEQQCYRCTWKFLPTEPQKKIKKQVGKKILLLPKRVMTYHSFTTTPAPGNRSHEWFGKDSSPGICVDCVRLRLLNPAWRSWWSGRSYLDAFARTMTEEEMKLELWKKKNTEEVVWWERSSWKENWERDYRDESDRVKKWMADAFRWEKTL